MIRIIVRTDNAAMAANVGGAVHTSFDTFLVDAPILEDFLLQPERESQTYTQRQVIGVEVQQEITGQAVKKCPHGAGPDEVCPECMGVPSDNPDDEAREVAEAQALYDKFQAEEKPPLKVQTLQCGVCQTGHDLPMCPSPEPAVAPPASSKPCDEGMCSLEKGHKGAHDFIF